MLPSLDSCRRKPYDSLDPDPMDPLPRLATAVPGVACVEDVFSVAALLRDSRCCAFWWALAAESPLAPVPCCCRASPLPLLLKATMAPGLRTCAASVGGAVRMCGAGGGESPSSATMTPCRRWLLEPERSPSGLATAAGRRRLVSWASAAGAAAAGSLLLETACVSACTCAFACAFAFACACACCGSRRWRRCRCSSCGRGCCAEVLRMGSTGSLSLSSAILAEPVVMIRCVCCC
mmetsp:Transcript_11536/g.33168  ORF Transcript_11536/g.33168 Transcript_11536/m.33168 type:complete len:235 (+) Transcript_11536:2429-3133(+)